MKILHRPDGARIHRRDEWKTSAYAFVPYETHFGELCGFADDVVEAGRGFGMHPHRDMEISTVMLAGAQRHEDSTGQKRLLDSHGVQTMSAGTGIFHSERNASATESFHSFQIWTRRTESSSALSPDGRDGSAIIGQDAFLSVSRLERGTKVDHPVRAPDDGVYVHCAAGQVIAGGQKLGPGDAVGIWEASSFAVEASVDAELVFVEVPMARGVRT